VFCRDSRLEERAREESTSGVGDERMVGRRRVRIGRRKCIVVVRLLDSSDLIWVWISYCQG
jgi:hypothetical protein